MTTFFDIADIHPHGPFQPQEAAVIAEAREILRRYMITNPVISGYSAARDYLRTAFAGADREVFRVLMLNTKNQLIEDHEAGRGTINHAPVYPREVIRRALDVGATSMILAHNHPSGDTTPSKADIEITRQLVEAAKVFGIVIHDHYIIGGDEARSLRADGLM